MEGTYITPYPLSFVVLLPGHEVTMGWRIIVSGNDVEVRLTRGRKLNFTTPNPDVLVETLKAGKLEKLDLREISLTRPSKRNGI